LAKGLKSFTCPSAICLLSKIDKFKKLIYKFKVHFEKLKTYYFVADLIKFYFFVPSLVLWFGATRVPCWCGWVVSEVAFCKRRRFAMWILVFILFSDIFVACYNFVSVAIIFSFDLFKLQPVLVLYCLTSCRRSYVCGCVWRRGRILWMPPLLEGLVFPFLQSAK
jgi:hypothetical protein